MSLAWTMFREVFLKNHEAATRNSKRDMAFWAWALSATFTLWPTKGGGREPGSRKKPCEGSDWPGSWPCKQPGIHPRQSEEATKGTLYGVLVRRLTFVTWNSQDAAWTDSWVGSEGMQASKVRGHFRVHEKLLGRTRGESMILCFLHVAMDWKASTLL